MRANKRPASYVSKRAERGQPTFLLPHTVRKSDMLHWGRVALLRLGQGHAEKWRTNQIHNWQIYTIKHCDTCHTCKAPHTMSIGCCKWCTHLNAFGCPTSAHAKSWKLSDLTNWSLPHTMSDLANWSLPHMSDLANWSLPYTVWPCQLISVSNLEMFSWKFTNKLICHTVTHSWTTRETSSHTTHEGTLSHSCLSSLSCCELILA